MLLATLLNDQLCTEVAFVPISRLPSKQLFKTATGPGSAARRSVTPSRPSHMDNPPATNIHAIVKTQIVFLLSTLTEDNFERNQMEIRSVCPILPFIEN
jgi:hypothetical protein